MTVCSNCHDNDFEFCEKPIDLGCGIFLPCHAQEALRTAAQRKEKSGMWTAPVGKQEASDAKA